MIGIGPNIRPRVARHGLDPTEFLIEGSGIAPYSAFSFRGLSADYVGFGGKCCRIRRSNDNAEADIGFVKIGANWVVDEAAMTTFTGANNAYIVRIYDQTGNNRDRYTGIANRQPIIVLGGTVQKYNGYPAVLFNDRNHTLQTLLAYGIGSSVWPNPTVSMSSIYVNKANTITGSGNDNTSLLFWGSTNAYAYVTTLSSASSAFGQYSRGNQYKNDAVVTISTRGQAYTELYNQRYILEDWNFSKWSNDQMNFSGYGITENQFWWFGSYFEEIHYLDNQIANRAAIMDYVAPYYSGL